MVGGRLVVIRRHGGYLAYLHVEAAFAVKGGAGKTNEVSPGAPLTMAQNAAQPKKRSVASRD